MVAVVRHWWLVLLLTLVGCVVGYFTSLSLDRIYESRTSILVGEPLSRSHVVNDDLQTSQQLARTYADVILQEPVLSGTVESLHLDTTWTELRTRVRAEVVRHNKQLITLAVRAPTIDESILIASEIPRQLAHVVSNGQASAADTRIRGFMAERLESVRTHIDRAERALLALRKDQTQASSPVMIENLRSQRIELERIIMDWYKDYSVLYRLISNSERADHMEVFEPPLAGSSPVWPLVPLHVGQSALIGLLLSLVIVYALEFRGDRSASPGDREA